MTTMQGVWGYPPPQFDNTPTLLLSLKWNGGNVLAFAKAMAMMPDPHYPSEFQFWLTWGANRNTMDYVSITVDPNGRAAYVPLTGWAYNLPPAKLSNYMAQPQTSVWSMTSG